MLFRAIFWIGLVALFLPRAPDLHANTASAGMFGGLLSPVESGASGSLEDFQTLIFDRLVQIHADIESQRRARDRAS